MCHCSHVHGTQWRADTVKDGPGLDLMVQGPWTLWSRGSRAAYLVSALIIGDGTSAGAIPGSPCGTVAGLPGPLRGLLM